MKMCLYSVHTSQYNATVIEEIQNWTISCFFKFKKNIFINLCTFVQDHSTETNKPT